MKKLYAIVLAVLLLFSLAACRAGCSGEQKTIEGAINAMYNGPGETYSDYYRTLCYNVEDDLSEEELTAKREEAEKIFKDIYSPYFTEEALDELYELDGFSLLYNSCVFEDKVSVKDYWIEKNDDGTYRFNATVEGEKGEIKINARVYFDDGKISKLDVRQKSKNDISDYFWHDVLA